MDDRMDLRNRIGLYGSYFLGMAGIGFTLPYLALFLGERGLSNRAIGLISTLAALAGLLQFPAGLWSDRLRWRKPFLVAALVLLAVATYWLRGAQSAVWIAVLVVLFAENGACRAVVESLAGAEAAHLARPNQIGAALGALRFWKPIGIVLVALVGGVLAERRGVASILGPLVVVQALAVVAALLIHEDKGSRPENNAGLPAEDRQGAQTRASSGEGLADRGLWVFLAAMVLFHVANAPAGVYLGPFLTQDLHAPERLPSYAFVVSMVAWMLVVWPAGRLADRLGRRPLLIAGWAAMTVRLALIALTRSPWQVVAIQTLDGLANGLFAVIAAAWVSDRLADPRRAGEAQVLVGSALVLGSAIGPVLSGLVIDSLGYRPMFWLLAAIGALATAVVAGLVPESVRREPAPGPLATLTDLSTTP
jgi:MFS family permease